MCICLDAKWSGGPRTVKFISCWVVATEQKSINHFTQISLCIFIIGHFPTAHTINKTWIQVITEITHWQLVTPLSNLLTFKVVLTLNLWLLTKPTKALICSVCLSRKPADTLLFISPLPLSHYKCKDELEGISKQRRESTEVKHKEAVTERSTIYVCQNIQCEGMSPSYSYVERIFCAILLAH